MSKFLSEILKGGTNTIDMSVFIIWYTYCKKQGFNNCFEASLEQKTLPKWQSIVSFEDKAMLS